ncbi:MAG: hypothetical protein ACJ76S_04940 [Solirubrobacteraceae bacterium]
MTAAPNQGLWRLYRELRQQGPLMAGALREPRPGLPPGPARLAAAGPRVDGRRAQYELLIGMIYEGYRLHYEDAGGGLVRPDDPDLALLLGDQLYALGLSRLADLGDLEAVGELADVISLGAQAQAARDRELAEAVWEAGAVAVGWGSSEPHHEAKALARTGGEGAAAALRRAARQARGGAPPGR